MKLIVSADEIVNGGLWRLFPTIEISKTKNIPCDYPGAMGVPVTVLDKIGKNDGHSGLILLDNCVPKIDGKNTYRRLIVRNLKPVLPKEIDLGEMLSKSEVKLVVQIGVERK